MFVYLWLFKMNIWELSELLLYHFISTLESLTWYFTVLKIFLKRKLSFYGILKYIKFIYVSDFQERIFHYSIVSASMRKGLEHRL